MTYGEMLAVDLVVLVACVLLVARQTALMHSHPAVVYFAFHVYVVTTRLIALVNDSPTLFEGWGSAFAPLREHEIITGALLCDGALVLMSVGWILGARGEAPATRAILLDPRIVRAVVSVAAPLGLVALLAFAAVPGRATEGPELGGWETSSYLQVMQTWPGLGLLALIYVYGFRRGLMIPMVLYLLIMAYQGYHRFRVLIPIILMAQIYLDRRGARWPGARMLAGFAIVAALFFPLKTIGKMAQQGESTESIARTSNVAIQEAARGRADDHKFLDQLSCVVALVEDSGTLAYGAPYVGLLVLPIPRMLWPGKPSVADYLNDISRPYRPMRETGMILTYIGEFFANFGYLGVLVGTPLVGYVFARAHRRAYAAPAMSVRRFAYLLVACNLLQIYRDGMVSIVFFVAVNMMPLAVIVLLHRALRAPVSLATPSVETDGSPVLAQ